MFNPESFPQDNQEEVPIEPVQEEPKEKKISRRDFLRRSVATLGGTVIASRFGGEANLGALENKEPEKKDLSEVMKEIEKKRREDYFAIKKIFAQSRKIKELKDKTTYLTEEFGDAGFLPRVVFNLERIPEILAKIDKAIELGAENIFVDYENPGDLTLGEELSMYSEGWQYLTKDQKLEKCSEVKFEEFSNETESQVKNALQKKYSSQWLSGTVGRIVLDKNTSDAGGSHGANPFTSNPALSKIAGREGEKSTIRVLSNGESLEEIIDIINHELAHSNDWNSSLLLSMPQRVEFLHDATRAFIGTKEFHSDYVPKYNNSEDKNYKYLKVTEYWAEAVRQCMAQGPENYKQTNPTEYALVKKWFDIINDIKE